MLALGLDPGTATTGYGLVRLESDGGLLAVKFGVITTPKNTPAPERLLTLYEQLQDLLHEHKPETVAVEKLFFQRNVTTALAVGQARGVVLLAAARAGLEVVEYTPSEVKQAVVGYGKADKGQMQEMVRLILGMAESPHPDDAADALAIALCHIQTAPFLDLTRVAGP